MRRYLESYLLCLLIVLLVACAAPRYAADSEVIDIQSEVLAKQISISGFDSRIEDNLLNVQVQVQNLLSVNQKFQYKFIWFDITGFELETENKAWGRFLIYGGKMETLGAWAPTPAARKFKVLMREL